MFDFFTFFFFNDTATTEIYTLSLHDALPIFRRSASACLAWDGASNSWAMSSKRRDRKSTRLNSSHRTISYAVFCLKKKKKKNKNIIKLKKSHTIKFEIHTCLDYIHIITCSDI